MNRKIQGFFRFLLAVAAVVIVLKALHWFPMAVQQETIRPYASIEEVRTKLNFRNLSVPVYFPQSIAWPASEILAQARPYPAVLLVFSTAGKRDISLVISQAASDAFPGSTLISFARIKEKVPYTVMKKPALLEVGTSTDDRPCSRLSWTDGSIWFTLTMKAPPFELIKIAESMPF